ncbi:hypothetical protein BRADI_1g31656v3 [Brachypodium distachyon]|uniref:Uncharacterized protein n=1 Tax=Brachypodium distachyon TaxID=15368 RepID=A0A2K2DM92_BRADI|nr:hypothetical protein BRADI_1g31656v3 [Brachypodium distachyon]
MSASLLSDLVCAHRGQSSAPPTSSPPAAWRQGQQQELRHHEDRDEVKGAGRWRRREMQPRPYHLLYLKEMHTLVYAMTMDQKESMPQRM